MTTFHRKPVTMQLGRLAVATLLASAYPAFADVPKQLGSQATVKLQEETSIAVAPPSDSKRVYVLDPGHFQMTSTVYSIDGKTTKLLGMTDAGTDKAPWLNLSVRTERGAENPLLELRRQYDRWRSKQPK